MRLQPRCFSCECYEINMNYYFIESEYIRSTASCWTQLFYCKVAWKNDTKPHDNNRIGIPFSVKLQVSPLFFRTVQERVKGSFRSSARRCSIKNVFLDISQNSQENACVGFSFLKSCRSQACNLIKKETPTQVYFCEFFKIFKNTFFIEHLQWLLQSL